MTAIRHSSPLARQKAALAALLSLIIPGSGQFYLKQRWRGVLIFMRDTAPGLPHQLGVEQLQDRPGDRGRHDHKLAVVPADAVLGLERAGCPPPGPGTTGELRAGHPAGGGHPLRDRLERHRCQARPPGDALRGCQEGRRRSRPPRHDHAGGAGPGRADLRGRVPGGSSAHEAHGRRGQRHAADQRQLPRHHRTGQTGAGAGLAGPAGPGLQRSHVPQLCGRQADRDDRHRPAGDHLLHPAGDPAQLLGRPQHHVARSGRQRDLLRHAHVPQRRARGGYGHLGPDRHRLGGAGDICRRDRADHPLGGGPGQAVFGGDRAHRPRPGGGGHGHRRQPAPDDALRGRAADHPAVSGLHAAALGYQHARGDDRRLCGRRRHRLFRDRDDPHGRLPGVCGGAVGGRGGDHRGGLHQRPLAREHPRR